MKKLMCVVAALFAVSCIFANESHLDNGYDYEGLMSAIECNSEKYYDIVLRYDENFKLTYDSVEEIFAVFSNCDEHLHQLEKFFKEQYDGRCADGCAGLKETLMLFNFER